VGGGAIADLSVKNFVLLAITIKALAHQQQFRMVVLSSCRPASNTMQFAHLSTLFVNF
jgi:hypothetical protein